MNHRKNRASLACTAALAAGLSLGLGATQAATLPAALHSAASTSHTEALNRELILRLYFQFFNAHDIGFAEKVIAPDYIQHNPGIATGRQPFVDLIQSLFQQFAQAHWDIDHLAAEGDLVWVQVHQTSTPGELGNEIMDIYRIADGVIVEHWDAGEPVSATPANPNTQF